MGLAPHQLVLIAGLDGQIVGATPGGIPGLSFEYLIASKSVHVSVNVLSGSQTFSEMALSY